jgi:hypothetical protein
MKMIERMSNNLFDSHEELRIIVLSEKHKK